MIDIEKIKQLALDGDLYAVQELITRLETADLEFNQCSLMLNNAERALEAAEQDAARYKYLRSRVSNEDCCDQCGYDGLPLRTGHLLDQHIDSAMKEMK